MKHKGHGCSSRRTLRMRVLWWGGSEFSVSREEQRLGRGKAFVFDQPQHAPFQDRCYKVYAFGDCIELLPSAMRDRRSYPVCVAHLVEQLLPGFRRRFEIVSH